MIDRFPNAPPQIKALPVDKRGYPVPAFVPWINGEPEFRAIEQATLMKMHRQSLCWVCGKRRGGVWAFCVGPMCAITRTNPEPPSHPECARFAAEACPFLSRPLAKRADVDDLREVGFDQHPMAIMRNPGCVGVWLCRNYNTFKDGPRGQMLFRLGQPIGVEWYAEGRTATRAEVEESIRTGFPLLMEQAILDGGEAPALLIKMLRRVESYLPPVEAAA